MFLDIRFPITPTFSFRYKGEEIKLLSNNSCITLKASDMSVNIFDDIPAFMREAYLNSKPRVNFIHRAMTLMVYKNLEFLEDYEDDNRIINVYTQDSIFQK